MGRQIGAARNGAAERLCEGGEVERLCEGWGGSEAVRGMGR